MIAMKKRSPGFSGKNRGVTLSVAASGVTHPSDAIVPASAFPAEAGPQYYSSKSVS